jgi:hypothetical protein
MSRPFRPWTIDQTQLLPAAVVDYVLLQGAALGAFATLGIGFSWGGFMLGSTAKTLADSTPDLLPPRHI